MDIRSRRRAEQDNIRVDSDGNWFHGEYPILHEWTVQFLKKNIAIDDDGRYYLTGEDKPIYFQIDDVAYWVVKIEKTIAGFLITLSDESIELLDPKTFWIGKSNALYCLIKGGSVPAKFSRAVYYDMMQNLEKQGRQYVLVLGRKKFPIQTKIPKEALFPNTKPLKKKKKPKAQKRGSAKVQKKVKKKVKKTKSKPIKNKKKKSPTKKKVKAKPKKKKAIKKTKKAKKSKKAKKTVKKKKR